MQCFYHVPVKVVYEVLGMSHHTLAPLRRKWNLRRWPFADVCRGAFKVDGAYVTWDDIEDQRKAMLALPDIDSRIAKILEVMGERAKFYKHKVNIVIARQRKEQQSAGASRNAGSEEKPVAKPVPCETPAEEQQHQQQVDESVIPSDAEWLESFSQLLAAELDAPPGELFPPLFE